MKQHWTYFAFPLAFITSSLSASDACHTPPSSQCIPCENPSAAPNLSCALNVSAQAELLWWSTYTTGLDYVVETKTQLGHPTFLNDATVHALTNTYDAGLRVSLAYYLPHDDWDLTATWTTYRNHQANFKTAPIEGTLFPIWSNPDANLSPPMSALALTKARGHWKFKLDLIDLALGRAFMVSHSLSMKPHIGLRYAKLDQTWHVHYIGAITPENQSQAQLHHRFKDIIHDSNDFWGFGLRSGLDTNWSFCPGFSLYTNAAAAWLHGHFHITQQEYWRNKSTREKQNRLKLNNRFRAGRATTDIALGLKWDHQFEGDRFHLAVKLGWEHHLFFGQNQLWQFLIGTGNTSTEAQHQRSNDSLSTQGWTLSANLHF